MPAHGQFGTVQARPALVTARCRAGLFLQKLQPHANFPLMSFKRGLAGEHDDSSVGLRGHQVRSQ